MRKLMITALLMIGMASFAQESPKPENTNRSRTETLTPEQRQELHLKKLTLDLNLNASQQKEFAALLKENRTKREAAKAEHKARKEKGQQLTKDERFALKSKMLDEQIAFKEKVRKILTPDQFTKWEKAQENRKRDFKDGRKPRKRHNGTKE